MHKNIFTIIGLIVGSLIWLLESMIHYHVFHEAEFEFIPDNENELWMRIVIVLLIALFGVFADSFSRKLIAKEKQIEAMNVYKSMIYAVHHILNNLLNQMQLFKIEALNCNDFNPDIIGYFDVATNEAADLVRKLSNVQDLTDDNIKASVYPEKQDVQPKKN